jgi:hypothetical protein
VRSTTNSERETRYSWPANANKAEAEAALEMMQDYPDRLRDRFVCWLAEGWLDGRRRAYGKGRTAQLGET